MAEREDTKIDEIREYIEEREISEKKRYYAYYDIDLDNLLHYDIVVDTTHNSPIEVENIILETMNFRALKP